MNWQAALCFVTLTAHCPVNGLTVTMNGNAVSGQTVNLLITPASGFITSTVVVTKPDSSVAGICNQPFGGSPGLCTPSADFSQDFATGLTTFSISALFRATDEGVWTFSHGTEQGTIDIKVLTLPIAINAPSPIIHAFTLSNGVTSAQYFVVTVPCAYPSASLTWVFIPVHGGSAASAQSSPAASCTSTGNAGCPDTGANSYTCTVRPQYNVDLAGQKVYLTARLTLTGEYQSTGMTLHITDTEITMQDVEKAEEDSKLWIIGAAFGAAALIILVLVAIVLCKSCKRSKENIDDTYKEYEDLHVYTNPAAAAENTTPPTS